MTKIRTQKWENAQYRVHLKKVITRTIFGALRIEYVVLTLPSDKTRYKTFAAGQLEYRGGDLQEALRHVHMYINEAVLNEKWAIL